LASADNDDDWALDEFGSAELGDVRRTARLVELARHLAEYPELSLPQALGSTAELKAAYRFFDNPDVAHDKVLASHLRSSVRRMRGEAVILAVQDTTFIDYSAHPDTEGLGPLNNKGGWGLLCHGTLAFTPARLPLGVLGLRVWARDPDKPKQRTTRRQRDIQDKESYKWIDSVQALAALARELPLTRVVSVADREADVYEFFTEAQRLGIDFVVRAAWDRHCAEPYAHVRETLAAAAILTHKTITLPASGRRKARLARLEVRACALTLRAPIAGSARGLPPLPLWGVWAYEIDAPAKVEPVQWLLLTSVPVTGAQEALERLDWYAARWGIELWHKVLKSGCRIETRQLETFDRLQRLLTLYAVIAWRIMYATMLARLVPDMSCTAILNEDEWQALYCRIHHTPTPPATAPPLKQAIRWIAQLGGFLGRAGDGEPGVKSLWTGFQKLIAMTEMYRIMKPPPPASARKAPKNVGNA
jgi:hypothetical protein